MSTTLTWHEEDKESILGHIGKDWNMKNYIVILSDNVKALGFGIIDESESGECWPSFSFQDFELEKERSVDDIVYWAEITFPPESLFLRK